MSRTCIACRLPIRTPWDGRLATREEIHHCASCDERVCWECREMDVNGDDHCPPCANELEIRDPGAFAH